MTGARELTYLGKTVLVVGAARSGIAATEFLVGRGARVVLTDSKSEESLANVIHPLLASCPAGSIELELGGHRDKSFGCCDMVIISPGVPLTLPCFKTSRKNGIPILAEVELAYRHLSGRILGITGSNGKTTTTSLVAGLLRGAGLQCHAAGNVGVPLIRFVEGSRPEDFYSVELSSFQLEGIQDFRPAVGAILNLTPDHMDRYERFETYIAAKERIFMNQQPCDHAVLNGDDPGTLAMAARVQSSPFLFSRRGLLENGIFIRDEIVVFRNPDKEVELFDTKEIRLKGGHNVENVLAACAISILAGAEPGSMKQTIREFKGVEHRLEWVAEIDGVQYFNDSKATNVDATVKSLEAFPGGIHLIAGGRDKGGDFTILRPLVERRVREVVLLGEASGKIREALKGTTRISEAKSLPAAVLMCRQRARAGEIVLLAPACASFDMFENYEHRGRVFKEAVRALLTGN